MIKRDSKSNPVMKETNTKITDAEQVLGCDICIRRHITQTLVRETL